MKCQIIFASTGIRSNNIILSKEPGELTCARSDSAAIKSKEGFYFLHYKETFLCSEGFLWGLENRLPLICWVTLDKSLSLSVRLSASLFELLMYLGFKVFGAGTSFCSVLHSTHHQAHPETLQTSWWTWKSSFLLFLIACNSCLWPVTMQGP